MEAIENATKILNEVLTPLTQKLYHQGENTQTDGTGEENADGENTVDAEFEEVKDDKK